MQGSERVCRELGGSRYSCWLIVGGEAVLDSLGMYRLVLFTGENVKQGGGGCTTVRLRQRRDSYPRIGSRASALELRAE